MTNSVLRTLLVVVTSVSLHGAAFQSAPAAPLDFTTFTFEPYPQTNGPLALWLTTPNEARIDDTPVAEGGTPNASLNVFYAPEESIYDKRFVGTLTPGTDDDPIGFVLGFRPGDADFFNFPGVLDADYLLIDWKGATQNFNFADTAGIGIVFNDMTPGGDMPAGLALSRVTGLPTADELWQHMDLVDNPDGAVQELARGATLGSAAYPRDNTSVEFDIRYTQTNITVLVDGVQQFSVDGDFPDGHFGLYSLNQGPSAVWTDFEVFDIEEPLTAMVDRDTGTVSIDNTTGAAVNFASYSILSGAGALDPDGWTSITDNYDSGGPESVDTDAWTIVSSTAFDLSEREETAGGDGGTLAAGQSLDLGAAWLRSPFEDLQIELTAANGDPVLVNVNYVNGPGGGPLLRSDLNGDGAIDAADWPHFYENTLADLSAFSPAGQYVRGDLDADGDNDVFDFAIFKGDFDAANGAGAFAAMVGGVPEPSSIVLVAIGLLTVALAATRRLAVRIRTLLPLALIGFLAACPLPSVAVPIDFTTFTVENFPHTDSNTDPANDAFPLADWLSVSTPAVATHNSNATPNVFYGTESALGKQFTGTLVAGTDDDMVGFVLGFQPGNATLGDPSIATADYLLIDWKGVSQAFNWLDFLDTGNVFHDLTPGTNAPVGLGLARITGLPTADELWGHVDLPENPDGAAVELSRGASLGSTAYPRDSSPVTVEIRYTSNYVSMAVNGVLELFETGSFGDGRFGLYTSGQGPPPQYSDFDVTDIDDRSDLLKAVVHRDTGEIEITNPSSAAVDFDYYRLSSLTGSLNLSGWNSLSDQEFQAVGSGEGENWAEAGGSGTSDLAELFLQSSSSLAASGSVSIGSAYNSQVNGEDLVLSYRLPDGRLEVGLVEYMGEVMEGIMGDYNGNLTVEQADLDLVLLNWGADGTTPPAGWVNDLPVGNIDQAELDGVLLNWGNMAAGGSLGAGSVPEPGTLILLLLSAGAVATCRRRQSCQIR